MHRYVFSRAMRKQDKRLEKDAKALEKARRHAGKGKYRASTIMGWKGGGYAGIREECARRNAIAERRRAAEREARREREREENLAQLERIRELERDRARQLADERERDLARYRAARAEERSQCSSPALTERSAPGTPDGPGRFDALLAECARKDSVAKMRAREREDRRRRRAATATTAETNTAAAATTADTTSRLDLAPSRADDPDEPPSPVAVAPSAAAAAAAAAEEGRTDALGAPGASRGGLRAKYEQVKVFRDGNSLFHCARLAEIACQAVERGGDDLDLDRDLGDDHDDARRRSTAGDAVAAVLRRGIRSLGQSQAAATAQSLREGALRRVATVAEDAELESESSFSLAATKFSSGAGAGVSSLSSDPSARAGLSADVTPTEVDAAIVRAVAGADLLCRNMQACPAAGAPLDNWRRAMISVGDRADAEIPPGDRELRPDEIDAGAAAVRDAYVRAMSRSNVPATELEVAALAAHLKRPVELIRGPASEGRSEGDGWRATCASTTYGAAHGRRGRAGFTLFWELGDGVPMGLPAGDFVLLVPREGMGRRRTAGAPEAGVRTGAGTGTGTGTTGTAEARGSIASPVGVSPGMSRARVGEERDGERGWSRAPPSAERNARDAAAGMLAAAADGNKVAVHRHARRGVSLAETDERGDTALHRAAASGSIGLVKAVLRHADRPGQPTRREMLEAVNVDGDTPLAAAARLGRVKLAKFLRREGAADPAGLLGRERGPGYASASSSAGYSSSAPSEGTSASDVSDSESERGGGSREWAGHGGQWTGHGGSSSASFYRREGGARRGGVGSGLGSASADGWATEASATSGAFGSESDFSDSDFAGNANRRSRAPGFWSDATPRGSDAETDAENASLWNSESESSYRGGDATDGYGTDATDTSEGSRRGDGGPTVRVPSAYEEEGEPSRFRAMGGGRGGDNVYRARDRDESRVPSFLR